MFISIAFRAASIDETNKTQQKVRGSKFIFKMSTIHANTCIQTTVPLRIHCRDDGVHGPAASTPSADVLSTFNVLSTHIMDPRAVDPFLKHSHADAVVHRIQIWRIRWPHLWRDKLWRLRSPSAAWWQCTCHVHDVLVPHLAKKRRNPRKQSGYAAEAYSAELYSGNSHRWPYPWFQEVQLRSTKTGHCNRNHQRLRSGVVVWMHVIVFAWMVDILNINFEPLTFCCVLFVSSILVSVNVIDINMCKVLILVWNVLLLCLRLSHGMVAT